MKTQLLSPPRAASVLAALLFAVLGQAPSPTRAQVDRVGSGPEALPAVSEVPLAVPAPRGLAARAGLGYGYTEGVLHGGDSHHRAQLDAAASLTPAPWGSLALHLLGRYDAHVGAGDDGDYGVVTETHVSGRIQHALSDRFHVGGRLALWLPGSENVGHAFAATSGDLQALATYLPEDSALTLGAVLGLRLDRSKHSGGDPRTFSLGDRLALGTSDAQTALHVGFVGAYRLGAAELVAEASYRMYFAYPGTSPIWVRAGARYRVSHALELEGLLGVSPSARPTIDAASPLRLVEPRFAIGIAATLALSSEPHGLAEPARRTPVVAQVARLHGVVLSTAGTPIGGARIALARPGASRELTSSPGGDFAADDLEPGEYRVQVSAAGWSSHEELATLASGTTPHELRVVLKRELPKGQIRGTVRKFDGGPIPATISIVKLAIKDLSAPDGSFEVNVPPGEYEVLVKARGYRSQTRRARVEEDGVAILIVELEPNSRR